MWTAVAPLTRTLGSRAHGWGRNCNGFTLAVGYGSHAHEASCTHRSMVRRGTPWISSEHNRASASPMACLNGVGIGMGRKVVGNSLDTEITPTVMRCDAPTHVCTHVYTHVHTHSSQVHEASWHTAADGTLGYSVDRGHHVWLTKMLSFVAAGRWLRGRRVSLPFWIRTSGQQL